MCCLLPPFYCNTRCCCWHCCRLTDLMRVSPRCHPKRCWNSNRHIDARRSSSASLPLWSDGTECNVPLIFAILSSTAFMDSIRQPSASIYRSVIDTSHVALIVLRKEWISVDDQRAAGSVDSRILRPIDSCTEELDDIRQVCVTFRLYTSWFRIMCSI